MFVCECVCECESVCMCVLLGVGRWWGRIMTKAFTNSPKQDLVGMGPRLGFCRGLGGYSEVKWGGTRLRRKAARLGGRR